MCDRIEILIFKNKTITYNLWFIVYCPEKFYNLIDLCWKIRLRSIGITLARYPKTLESVCESYHWSVMRLINCLWSEYLSGVNASSVCTCTHNFIFTPHINCCWFTFLKIYMGRGIKRVQVHNIYQWRTQSLARGVRQVIQIILTPSGIRGVCYTDNKRVLYNQ